MTAQAAAYGPCTTIPNAFYRSLRFVIKLSELSRSTCNQLKNGTVVDLGFAKWSNLLSVLGLKMGGLPPDVANRHTVTTSRAGIR